jgi:hypothetical protein
VAKAANEAKTIKLACLFFKAADKKHLAIEAQ